MAQELINTDVVRRSENLLSSDLDNETIMIDLEKGMYYGLNAVAGRIWALVEQPTSVCGLCDQLLAEYEVSPELCEQEVTQFLINMLERGTVEVAENAIQSNNTQNGNSCKKLWQTPQLTVISPVVTSTRGGPFLSSFEASSYSVQPS